MIFFVTILLIIILVGNALDLVPFQWPDYLVDKSDTMFDNTNFIITDPARMEIT